MSACRHRKSGVNTANLSEEQRMFIRLEGLSTEVGRACEKWLAARGLDSRTRAEAAEARRAARIANQSKL